MTLNAMARKPSRSGDRPEHPVRMSAHRRYSRFVGVLKIVLPMAALMLLGLILVWPRLSGLEDRFQIGFANIGPDAVESLSMVNARYFGIDEQNRPFTVTADVATEERPKDVILLEAPKADFTTKSGANVYVEARQGFYHQKTQLLDLVGDVALFHDQGYELHTQEAQVDLARSGARGEAPVTGHGPQGALQGEGFEIRDGGAQVLVTGRSTLQLKGAKGK